MRRLVIAAARRARGVARRCAPDERGFTIVEVLAAIVVLAIGLGAMFQLMIAATHATATNRIRQAETSLARELTEDSLSLSYTQLTTSGIASALQATVPNSQLSGSSLIVTRPVGSTSSGASANYPFTATFSACSLDDPADGYGNHNSAPISGGSWCTDVAANGTQDSNPDDYKRVSVTVSPSSGRTTPTVQQTILVYAKATHPPAVSCLAAIAGGTFSCPGANLSIKTGTSQQFNVTTTVPAASVEWLVNGSLPTSAQQGTGLNPYTPSGTNSQFSWYFPTTTWNSSTYTIDGTYTISALALDANGNQGTKSSLQVTVNEHMALPPSSVIAGWNQQIQGVDLQWTPSVDQDVLYYIVYNQNGQVAGCTHVTGFTCTDLSAPSPGTEPTTCTGSPNNYQSFTTANPYWVVGVDTDPSTGQARISTFQPAHVDANLCDHPPSTPTGLSPPSGGTLNWSLPSSPMDPDPGDTIKQWRIYRWPVGQNPSFPGSRLDLIGEKDSLGNDVTSYTDRSADPGGVAQDYCVTAVDSELNESTCSTIVSG
jgi:prepilin-type N-terminal cleavage/methylation domain-containing protein